MSALDKAVSKDADGRWDFQCPGVQGSPCDGGSGRPFHSDGWPTKATATARGAEHFAEHKGEGVTSTLEEFRAKHKLGVDAGGNAVRLEDL
jgi:hypothetical protein